jgi:hypothetical protein
MREIFLRYYRDTMLISIQAGVCKNIALMRDFSLNPSHILVQSDVIPSLWTLPTRMAFYFLYQQSALYNSQTSNPASCYNISWKNRSRRVSSCCHQWSVDLTVNPLLVNVRKKTECKIKGWRCYTNLRVDQKIFFKNTFFSFRTRITQGWITAKETCPLV